MQSDTQINSNATLASNVRRQRVCLCISTILVVALDQLTKVIAKNYFGNHPPIHVVPGFFTLHYVANAGAAWGMLHGQRLILVAVSIVMLALLVFDRRELMRSKLTRAATAVLSGGIIGNMIDRMLTGLVTDFLDFHYYEHHFPTFNIADTAICVGVGLLILASLPCFQTKQ